MEADWVGSAVSIVCDDVLGVFQGIIQAITEDDITIVRAFRNGVPLRKQNAEVVLKSSDILKINLIPAAEQSAETLTSTVINKPTPVKLPNFSNILGAKQQQQLQQQQQCLLEEQSVMPKANVNGRGNGNAGRNGGGVASGGSTSKSTLSDKMQEIKLNGVRRTPKSSHAPSAQMQQQPQLLPTTPNSVAAFFGNMIPAKVEVKLGSTVLNGTGSYSNGPIESNCSSSAEGSSGSSGMGLEPTASSSSSSRPIDIVGGGAGFYQQQQQQAIFSNGQSGKRNGNGNGNGNSYTNGSNGNGNGNGKNKQRNRVRRESSMRQYQAFGSEADDPLLHDDFDFEGNLALFDKEAIWFDIESTNQKPDVVSNVTRATATEKKYRHDENILASKPLQLRQIESIFGGTTDFVTDDGLIIPTIPAFVRTKIELSAAKAGLSLQRQIDILARGASDLAITLLGGARRLTQTNNHQWPNISIICDGAKNLRTINTGAVIGRQLASHGLNVALYVEQVQLISNSFEVALFKATDNTIVHNVDALPKPDLVILSTHTANLSESIKKWLSVNRASVLAIDPPPCGINDVAIKYSIFPILPLNGISTAISSSATATPTPIATTSASTAAAASTATATAASATSTNNCGKLYLCNLGIPDKFYRDCGIKYKSPYGHKYVIPIHSKD